VALAGLLWLSILACVVLFRPVSAWAAGLMLPYLLWVGFAVVLTEALRRRNT
jgi:tryptophan-rich sensory protein